MHPILLWASMLLCPGFGSEVAESLEPDDLLAAPASDQGPVPMGEYCMMGRVLIEGTGEPVRGAVARVATGASERPVFAYEFRSAESDGDGDYVVALPVGTARAWSLQPPPGYWTSSASRRRGECTGRTIRSAGGRPGASG